jgi:hypothetical protein
MKALIFLQDVIDVCSPIEFVKTIDIILLDEPVAKARIAIESNIFIEVFFNAETHKYSFALIKNDERIYGIDNTRGWHIHPFENSTSHSPTEETTFSQFIQVIKQTKDKWIDE